MPSCKHRWPVYLGLAERIMGQSHEKNVSFHDTYPALARSVGAIRAALTHFLEDRGVERELIESVRVAVSEAATNVVIHAYRDRGRPGVIEVDSHVDNGQVEVTVGDRGSGFGARRDSPGLGLGLAIVASVTSGFDLVSRDNGLAIRMRFSYNPCER
jgi:anti-sigma regulatory factor (Ser/Thr protein kinase)